MKQQRSYIKLFIVAFILLAVNLPLLTTNATDASDSEYGATQGILQNVAHSLQSGWQKLKESIGASQKARRQRIEERRNASKKEKRPQPQEDEDVLRSDWVAYDYIIVGAGAAGCPLAFTLASEGYSTLLIERGVERNDPSAEMTRDVHGAGIGISNPRISQTFVTPEGFRTHVASVMGGGASINLGVYIQETDEYFKHLSEVSGVEWQKPLVDEAYSWVSSKIKGELPPSQPYAEAWKEMVNSSGYEEYVAMNGSSYSDTIHPGKYWKTKTLFEPENGYRRFSSDDFLYFENGTMPEKLTVLSGHIAEEVQFQNDLNGVPTATCIRYKKTTGDDLKPQGTSHASVADISKVSINEMFNKMVTSLFDPLSAVESFFARPGRTFTKSACIKPGGEIILSSGTILTSKLLFQSGVGPMEQIKELGVKLVKDIPTLGQNISDRTFVNVGLFYESDETQGLRPPTLCQYVALSHKEGCEQFASSRTEAMSCPVTMAEEMSGGRISEGIIYASRFPFPPEWRNQPVVTFMFKVLEDCSYGVKPYGNPLLEPLCKIASPVVDCFRRAVANFAFAPVPVSRGSIKLSHDGNVRFSPNYMKSGKDLLDTVLSLSSLVKAANGDVYEGIMESQKKLDGCPVKLFNGLLDIVLEANSLYKNRGLFDFRGSSEFEEIMEQLASTDVAALEGEMRSVESYRSGILGRFSEELKHQFSSLPDGCQAAILSPNYTIDGFLEAECGSILQEKAPVAMLRSVADSTGELRSELKDNEANFIDALKEVQTIISAKAEGMGILPNKRDEDAPVSLRSSFNHFAGTQWASSFPLTLPDPDDAIGLADYVLKYMTSVWHHAGAAPIGTVVDENFQINGMNQISIVDAGVLNQITRLNPTATILMIGRYAGLLKARGRAQQP